MLHSWRPIGQVEIAVARTVRRHRIAQALRLLSLIVTGLALGVIAAECDLWLRTAKFGGPYVFEVYLALHTKLPHSEWPGMSKAIIWMLVQPACLVGSVLLAVLALLLHVLAAAVRPSDRPATFRFRERHLLLLPAPAAVDPVVAQIREAYRRMDAIREPAPSKRRPPDAE